MKKSKKVMYSSIDIYAVSYSMEQVYSVKCYGVTTEMEGFNHKIISRDEIIQNLKYSCSVKVQQFNKESKELGSWEIVLLTKDDRGNDLLRIEKTKDSQKNGDDIGDTVVF